MAGVFTADLVLENSGHTEVMIMGQTLSFDIWGLFVLGLCAGVLVISGVQLLLHGMARDRDRRRVQRQRERDLAALTRAVPPPAATTPRPAPTAPRPTTPAEPRPAATAPRPAPAEPRPATAVVSRPATAAASRPDPVAASSSGPASSSARPAGRIEPRPAGRTEQAVAGGAASAAGGRRDGASVDGQPAASRAAERMPTPSRSTASPAPTDSGDAAPAAQPQPVTPARRGDRLVARVADLARGNRTSSAESTARDTATPANVRS
ncbi:hypothetical protein [Candidatus Frankia nodulisporulans]|uniref:hypothetical protein n=1 Tax=Candidatus Frankia nodulisporulans TaxID=2060052 RepID=UPI001CDD5972|nr:hypothetical protein [Candidatus Frankia nodulisporulans]